MAEKETTILFKEESYRIIGACFEVYKVMGSGFLEAVYQECLESEFTRQGIPYRAQVQLPLQYKQVPLKQVYVADFDCFDQIIVELKAVSELSDVHRAQLHNYLKATGRRLGILANFGHFPNLEHERIGR